MSEKDNPETDASNVELEPRSPFLDQNVYILVQVNLHDSRQACRRLLVLACIGLGDNSATEAGFL